MTTKDLERRGFDLSEYNPSSGYWYPRCSQCEALVVNGCACHETGCPNQQKEEDYEPSL